MRTSQTTRKSTFSIIALAFLSAIVMGIIQYFIMDWFRLGRFDNSANVAWGIFSGLAFGIIMFARMLHMRHLEDRSNNN
jgi:hypothetical protein